MLDKEEVKKKKLELTNKRTVLLIDELEIRKMDLSLEIEAVDERIKNLKNEIEKNKI